MYFSNDLLYSDYLWFVSAMMQSEKGLQLQN